MKKEQEEKISLEDLKTVVLSFRKLELEASAKSLVLHDELLLLKKSKLPKIFFISYLSLMLITSILSVYVFLPITILGVIAFLLMCLMINKFDDEKENLINEATDAISNIGSIIAYCKYFSTSFRQIKSNKDLLKQTNYLRESQAFLEERYIVDPRKIENARILCENSSTLNDNDNFIERLQLREAEAEAEAESINEMKNIKI